MSNSIVPYGKTTEIATRAAGATAVSSTAGAAASSSGGLLGAARGLMSRFASLHPATKAIAIAGAGLLALNAIPSGKGEASDHPAAQRVA